MAQLTSKCNSQSLRTALVRQPYIVSHLNGVSRGIQEVLLTRINGSSGTRNLSGEGALGILSLLLSTYVSYLVRMVDKPYLSAGRGACPQPRLAHPPEPPTLPVLGSIVREPMQLRMRNGRSSERMVVVTRERHQALMNVSRENGKISRNSSHFSS